MDKWEYKIGHFHEDWMGNVRFEDYLNWHQGWELVTVIPKSHNPKIIDCIFKRKIQQVSNNSDSGNAQKRTELLDKTHNQVDKIIDKLNDKKICQ